MGEDNLPLFRMILLANAVTMIVTLAAALRRPVSSYRLMGALAIGAFIAALAQVVTARFSVLSLLLSSVLVLSITLRVALNTLESRSLRRRRVSENGR